LTSGNAVERRARSGGHAGRANWALFTGRPDSVLKDSPGFLLIPHSGTAPVDHSSRLLRHTGCPARTRATRHTRMPDASTAVPAARALAGGARVNRLRRCERLRRQCQLAGGIGGLFEGRIDELHSVFDLPAQISPLTPTPPSFPPAATAMLRWICHPRLAESIPRLGQVVPRREHTLALPGCHVPGQ
jgi:hypothetical protein